VSGGALRGPVKVRIFTTHCTSEMKVTLGGIPATNFSLALKGTYKNGGEEKKTNTLWIREHIVRNPADYPKTSTVGRPRILLVIH